MIRRTAGLGAVAVLTALTLWTTRTPTTGFAVVIGDGSNEVAIALPDARAVRVVLLRRWQSLEHIPDMRRLCRAACDGTAAVVEVRQPGWRGLRRTLFIDMGAMGAGATLDAGEGVSPDEAARVAAVVTGEGGRRVVWRLPFGL